MHKYSGFAAALACFAALAMAACSSNGVTPSGSQLQTSSALGLTSGWIHKDGITYHVPHYMATRAAARGQIRPMGLLTYSGGPVQVTPTVYLIFWNVAKYGDRQGVESLLQNYIGHMGGSGHNNIYVQYYEVSNGNKVFVTNPSNQYGGSWEDSTNPEPRHPTDSQIAAEAIRGVQHFGYNASASYVVVTPHGRSTSGFNTQWCAYHSATTSNGNLVSYTDLPYIPDAGANCGANIISPPSDESGADEGVTIVGGHEQGESVTDINPPSGWYNNTYGEIGDICAWTNIQNDPFGSNSYSSQPMYSNASNSCVHSYP